MQKFEIMTIADIDLGEQGAKDFSKKVQTLIAELGGKVEKTDFWGKRKFAYEIKHKKEGFYDVMNYELAPGKADSFKTKLNLENGLVRYLITAETKKEKKES